MTKPLPPPPPPQPTPPARRIVIEDDSKARQLRKDRRDSKNDRQPKT